MNRFPPPNSPMPHRFAATLAALAVLAVSVCPHHLTISVVQSASAQQVPPQAVEVAELSPEAEAAINRGLAYLARTQKDDGGWGRPAYTAIAMMAFMLKGHFPDRGPYGRTLDRAVENLVAYGERGGGYLGVTHHHGMYDHGLATLALAEVWGQSDHPKLRSTLKRAVDVIVRSQHASGGWRYQPQPIDHDISVTIMQLMALISAHEAGILVPDEVIEKVLVYVRRCQNQDGGFAYRPGQGPSAFARSAAGALALQMGGDRDTDELKQALAYLWEYDGNVFDRVKHFCYAHYYAIQSMYQAGDAHYQRWYPKISEALIDRQRSDGKWMIEQDDAYSTGMAILILGVPYRFLPIYQR